MTTFREFVERPRKILYVFDVDGTLFHTSTKVAVVKDGKIVKQLSDKEFVDYALKSGESFDYSEFRDAQKFANEAKPIDPVIRNLIRVHDKIKLNLTPGSKIIVLTARGTFDDEDTFHDVFRDHGIDIDDIPTLRAARVPGDKGPAIKKTVVIRRYLDKKQYDEVHMLDDSKPNLVHFLHLKHEYPGIVFRAFHISKSGKPVPFTG